MFNLSFLPISGIFGQNPPGLGIHDKSLQLFYYFVYMTEKFSESFDISTLVREYERENKNLKISEKVTKDINKYLMNVDNNSENFIRNVLILFSFLNASYIKNTDLDVSLKLANFAKNAKDCLVNWKNLKYFEKVLDGLSQVMLRIIIELNPKNEIEIEGFHMIQ